MIISKTPLRISLIGGGTDMPDFYEKHPGAVISFAINKFIYVMINNKFDNKFRVSYSKTENVETLDEIKHDLIRETLKEVRRKQGMEVVTMADIPGNGTGLGSSSALILGLLNCIYRDQPANWLAETAFSIESKNCRKPVGKQDHYASALGGFKEYKFNKRSVSYSPIKSNWDCDNPWSQNELEEQMLLLWTGMARSSTDILQKQKDNFSTGSTLNRGKELIALVDICRDHLMRGNIKSVATCISDGWEIKKAFAPWITNTFIDNWYEIAMKNGAWGGKLLGAGGGGFLFFIAPPDTHQRIVKTTGLQKIYFRIENRGSEVIYEA